MREGRAINAVEQQFTLHELLNVCLRKRDGETIQQRRNSGSQKTGWRCEYLLDAIHVKSKHPKRWLIAQPYTPSPQPILIISGIL